MTAETCQHASLPCLDSPEVLWRRCILYLAKHTALATNIKTSFLTLKLAVSHQRATESDPSDIGAQIRHSLQHTGGWVGVKVGVLNHEFSDAGENSRQAHEAVEGRHKLRQVRDFDTLGNGETCRGDMKISPKEEEQVVFSDWQGVSTLSEAPGAELARWR